MNEQTKMLWAATLLVVGYIAASWLGPPVVPESAKSAPPAGWTSQRLTPLSQDAPASRVAPASEAPSLDVPIATDAWQTGPQLSAAARHVPALRRDGALNPPPAPQATDDWWSRSADTTASDGANLAEPSPRALAPSRWSDPDQPVRALTDTLGGRSAVAGGLAADRPAPPALLAPDGRHAGPRAAEPAELVPVELGRSDFDSANAATATNFDAPIETVGRRHIVSDGDSLPRLAKRYLGDAALASSIFAANRDTLSSPRLLPIGAELVIPDRDAALAAGDTVQNPRARLQPPVSVHAGYRGSP